MTEIKIKGFPQRVKKKKILLLSDDLRVHSGIATMSREIILGTVHKYDWVQLGGAVKHPEEGKILDLSKGIAAETGVEDASVKLYPISGYGDQMILRELIRVEQPDAIMHFTDPRFWGWLYMMEHEIRTKIPLIYYNIWDDLPYPHWNENFYESCDLLMAISRQTYAINRAVCQRRPLEDWQSTYVPHGIDPNKFYPIDSNHPEFSDMINYANEIFKGSIPDFILFYNSRNIRRKSTSDLMLAFKQFVAGLDESERDSVALLMHTDIVDEAGTDLRSVHQNLLPECRVIFYDKKIHHQQMNWLYNISSVGCNVSSAEGFGLSCAESIMSATPVIVNCVGGLQDQMGLRFSNGNPITLDDYTSENPSFSNWNGYVDVHPAPWCYGVWPQMNLQGSPPTPYIYDSKANIFDITQQIRKCYCDHLDGKLSELGLQAREWALGEGGINSSNMCNRMIDSIENLFLNWEPKPRFKVYKVEDRNLNYPTGILI